MRPGSDCPVCLGGCRGSDGLGRQGGCFQFTFDAADFALFGDRDAFCSANEYILLSTRDIPCEAIYSTDYQANDLAGFIIDYAQLMPVVYVKRGVHLASTQT